MIVSQEFHFPCERFLPLPLEPGHKTSSWALWHGHMDEGFEGFSLNYMEFVGNPTVTNILLRDGFNLLCTENMCMCIVYVCWYRIDYRCKL